MELQVLTEKESEKWDSMVEKSSFSTIFHKWKFLKIIEKQTESTLYPLLALEGTTPVGIYPLFVQKKRFANLVLSPPSRALLLYLGPVLIDLCDDIKQSKKELRFIELQTKVDEFIKSNLKFSYIRIRLAPDLVDARPFLWSKYEVTPLYTYIIDLDMSQDEIWKNFNSQVRIDINKTQKSGVTARGGNREDLDFLRASLADRFIEQGLSKTKKRSGYFEEYLNEVYDIFFPENFKIFIGEYNRERIGGLTLLCYKKKASLWAGIPKTNVKGIYPNDLVVWESIKWAHNQGYKEYEIMCAGDDPRLRHFKSKFNPRLSLWYSAEKFSSPIYQLGDKLQRGYQSIKNKK